LGRRYLRTYQNKKKWENVCAKGQNQRC
jgi:hypothetical protein